MSGGEGQVDGTWSVCSFERKLVVNARGVEKSEA